MRLFIWKYSTHRIGASPKAGEALFGQSRGRPFTVLYYGMDFRPFQNRQPTDKSKCKLGIPASRKVVGHVGRFVAEKNHGFLLDVFHRLVLGGLDAQLLLVGDGPLRPEFQSQIQQRGLSDRCTLAGSQEDVVPYFSAMDVFVFPSLWEGLGLVALEAQAAGIPVVASTGVPVDVDTISGLVQHVPLSAGAPVWASTLTGVLEKPASRRGDEPFTLQNSRFGLPICLETLCKIYSGSN